MLEKKDLRPHLRLNDVEANALYAARNGSRAFARDPVLYNAWLTVKKKVSDMELSREEFDRVEIDEAWIRWDLLKEVNELKSK